MANERLSVGVIQTSLDSRAAWDVAGDWEKAVTISAIEEGRAKREIRHLLAALDAEEEKCDVILLPELSVPLGFESRLQAVSEEMQSIIIAGLDYQIESGAPKPTVSNEAVVIIPKVLNGKKVGAHTQLRRVGKTYAAPAEERQLKRIGVSFQPRPTIWLFDSEDLGKFAVAVCYDFLDLDRLVLYRNKIQTLFILAYNRDTNSFDHVAEAVSRVVFCNVVICNCGHFGGSLAVSPLKEQYDRTIYRHMGKKQTSAQHIKLPLRALIEHQSSGSQPSNDFKSLPPGYQESEALSLKNVKF